MSQLCRDSKWSNNLCLSVMNLFYSVFIMLLDVHTAAYQEAFMIDFNNLTYEPTDFLSHPSPFFKYSFIVLPVFFQNSERVLTSLCSVPS